MFEAAITKATPKGLTVRTTITAPRPVLTPFTLRFVVDEWQRAVRRLFCRQ